MESHPTFQTPEDELRYLRAEVARKEEALRSSGLSAVEKVPMRADTVAEAVREHAALPKEAVAEAYRLHPDSVQQKADELLESLKLGNDAGAIRELIATMEAHGIKNALSVVEKMENPRIEDDFHRYLVRRIAAGMVPAASDEKAPRFKALHMTLYEVALPAPKAEEGGKQKALKELLSSMEQFYAGLLSVGSAEKDEPPYFALELAVPSDTPELQFFVSVPSSKRALFEKNLLAIFPDAYLSVMPNDYNIFVESGTSVASVARLSQPPVLPIKEYDAFDYDPINAIMNAFANIEHVGEGAALQLIIEPRGDRHVSHYRKILNALRKGMKKNTAFTIPETAFGELMHDMGKIIFSNKPKDEEKEKQAEIRQIEENKSLIEAVEKKVSAPIVGVSLRLAVSSADAAKSEQVLGELEASFNQFANTQGNRFSFVRVPPKRLPDVFERFSFRLPANEPLPLSLHELTTVFHFPPEGIKSTLQLKQSRFTHAGAPLSLSPEGIVLGTNTFRAKETTIRLSPEDRLRHCYVIGQTGTGKTGLLKNMIIQDIRNGYGCCFIDPHGNDILDILAAIPPERYDDVIYFNPSDLSRPFGLNFLEYNYAHPEQKTFIVNELLAIFRRLYGSVPESMGPAFEQYFRNSTLLVMEDPESGSTILDIARVLSNASFRKRKLAKSRNPVVNQFWTEIATKAGGEASLENIVPYITNKFDDFTANDFMRPIVGQQKSSFNFRDIMDDRKILLVNLSKGMLGERNANLLGLIIVGKIFMAALSRADAPRASHAPFYFYMDEFQNITTDSIPGILSEARKYKLSLSVAHQFLSQIDEKIRDAVFGNVGNMIVFRVGEEDAEFFAKQFTPVFSAPDFVNIENRNAYAKILAKGVPQKPFDFHTADIPPLNHEQTDDLIQLSALTYGRDREAVESAIQERYLSVPSA